MKKTIISSCYLTFVAVILIYPFLIGLDSINGIIKKQDIVSMSYGVILSLIAPIISYFAIDVALRSAYYFFYKKTTIKKTYKFVGVIIASWIFLSLPISLGMGFYLTSNGYQRCPSTNLFTQYYTTDLSLCPDPYYEERAGVKR
ncbi:DUF1240 domain-containing protein [Morganella morganii]|nr:DUF1240 domain-containing protein [Morganella morganii]